MSSQVLRPRSKPIRHRIIEIELVPITSNRQISAKVFVDGKVMCELPWVKSGRPLRWTKLIVYDGPDDSKITLEVCEKHAIKDQRFRSNSYVISSVQQQTEVTVGLVGLDWNATFRLLTPAAAEQYYTAGLEKLREMTSASSALEKLGRARPVFEAMLQLGNELSEIHPTAKMVFVICTKAWEKLEAQEECDENVRQLLDGLGGIMDFVELVKRHARTEKLQATIGGFLTLMEDVSIYAAERAESTKGTGRTLRGLLDSREQNKTRMLLSRFERLRAELDIGIGAETHKKVHMIDLHALLRQLQPITPSGYDPSRLCQDGTRERIISDIISWTEHPESSECLLWVQGKAGIGKSSIATSVCQRLANDNILAASFFCQRDDPGLRDPLRLINSVAHGLATRYPPYAQKVALAIQEDRELCTAHMDIRYKGLIQKPLQALADPGIARPFIVLVDALDECGTNDTRMRLLRHLSDMSKLVPWFKLIITSRPDAEIQEFFQDLHNAHVLSRNVHNFDASDDIRAYIEKELGDIARKHQWDEGSIDRLCEQAGGVFIWAATVKKYLTSFRGSTLPRLRKVLYDQRSTVSDHLDMLYRGVILTGMKDAEEDQKLLFCQCIGVVVEVSMRQPLSIPSLGQLLLGQLDPLALGEVVGSIDAVLHVDDHHDGVVRFYHPSFADFATNPSRSGDLYIFPVQRNAELAAGCLKTMERELRFNICDLETSYLLNSEVPDLAERIKSNISDQLGYACTYWISHLMNTPKGSLASEIGALMNSPRVLYWLEVLSLLGRVEAGLQGLLDLQEWLLDSAGDIAICIEDIYRFTSAFYDPISSSTPHIYVSALAFAPSSAHVVRQFGSLFPNTVTVGIGGDIDWPRWHRTLVHPNGVLSLAVSSDGRLLVTGCWNGAVYIWDIKSGTTISEPLCGNLGYVRCLAFSSSRTRIVAGYFNRALQIWDIKNGVTVGEPLRGHSEVVICVVFSPDDRLIASGSVDKTIRLWDNDTRAAVGTIVVEDFLEVESVAFSPDGQYLVSSLSPGTVRVWGTTTKTIVWSLSHDDAWMYCAAFSPDGDRISYGSSTGLGTIQWDSDDGTMVGDPIFHSRPWRARSLAFSPDGHRAAFGTYDRAIHVWDLQTATEVGEPLTGHFDSVDSVAFLPDGRRLASASGDKTVRLWDTRARPSVTVNEPLAGHSSAVAWVMFSPDGSHIVSGSHDKTIRTWDARTGTAVGDSFIHTRTVAYIAFSPDGNYIISSCFGGTLHIWDIQAGTEIAPQLVIDSGHVHSVAFSHDGMHVVSGSEAGTITVTFVPFISNSRPLIPDFEKPVQTWSAEHSDEIADPLNHKLAAITSVAFSPDRRHVVSGSWGGLICLWDAKTGAAIGDPIVAHPHGLHCVAFSPDSSRFVSSSEDGTLRMWNTRLGTALHEPLIGHSHGVTCVAFSPDGKLIASCASDRTVRLWDGNSGVSIGKPFVGHTLEINSVAFSPDGNYLVSGSWDCSVRVWKVNANSTDENSEGQGSSQHNTVSQNMPIWPSHTYALPPHPVHHGWVSLDGKSLLFWLPAHYRREYSPNMVYTISADQSQSTIRLDLSNLAHGSNWTSVACDKVRQNLV